MSLSMVLMFYAIPLFIHIKGGEVYGVFSLLMISGNLNVLANLGLTSSLVKFLASQGKQLESNYDIVVSIVIIAIISLCIAFIGIIFRSYILSNILNIPPGLYHESLLLWICLLLANIFLLLGQIFNSILDSQQNIHLTNLLQLGYNILYWVSIIVVLYLGYSLAAVGLGILLAAVLWCVSVGIISLYQWGSLSVRGLKREYLRIAKKQLSYSIQIYTGSMLTFFF